jgi:Tol biopolymer transport system component/DNA-binding winged helix-turn-helix (wHTH) protein
MNAASNIFSIHTSPRLRIGQCVVELDTHRILRGDHVTRMSPKSVALMRCLLKHVGQTVSRDQLIEEVWNSQHASDELLTQAIKELRRAFKDDPKTPQYIETIPKGGYRLIASIENEVPAPALGGTAVAELVTATTREAMPYPANDQDPKPRRAAASLAAYVFATGAFLIAVAVILISVRLAATDAAKIDLRTQSITSGHEHVEFPSISPDGTRVVYAAQRPGEKDSHLYAQTANGSSPMALEAKPNTSDTYPVWSPNGTSIAFMRFNDNECKIHIVAATGGASRPVTSCYKDTLAYFDWTPDSQYLITQDMPAGATADYWVLMTIRIADGYRHEIEYAHDANSDDLNPHYSSDGRWIAFRRGQNPISDLFVMNANGKDLRRLTNIRSTITGFAWTSDSRNIVFSSNYQDTARLYLLNVETGSIAPTNQDNTAFPSIGARSSNLAALRDHTVVNLAEYSLDAAQQTSKLLPVRSPSNALDTWPAYSPRENYLCFVSDRSGASQLWLSKSGMDEAMMLTEFSLGETLSNPKWAPDGEHVLFISQSKGRSRLFSIDIVSHQVHEMIPTGENIRVASYAPGGKALDIASDRSGSLQLGRFDLDSGKYSLLLDQPVIAFGYGPNEEIYYTLASTPGLFRTNGTGSELVTDKINPANRLAWQTSKSGIFFIRSEGRNGAALHLIPWSDKTSAMFATVENFGANMTLAVAPDESRWSVPLASHSASSVIVARLAEPVR